MKRVGHIVEYVIIRLAGFILMVLPLSFTYGAARLLGLFVFDVLRIRRRVTLENLTHALGDRYSARELVRIARESYRQMAMTFAEILILPRLKKRMREIVNTDEFQPLMDAYRKGRGVILVTGHYGSWEFAGATVTSQGVPMTAIGKTQANRFVDGFLNSRREYMDIGVVSKGASVKKIVQALRNGETIALVSDQNAGKRGVFVPFFGRLASTPRGAAQFTIKYRAPLVLMACERTTDGQYHFLSEELSVGDNETVESLTARITAGLEKIIRRHPEQYFWMHRRWKTQPSEISDGTDGSVATQARYEKTGGEP